MNAIQRLCQTDRCFMIDPDTPVDPKRVIMLRREATDALGVFFDARVVERIADCIVAKVEQGVVEEGIPYRDLVGDSGAPSWVAHHGLLESVLVLVSLRSYERDGVLLSALTQATQDRPPPTEEFCAFLEALGLVSSRRHREECLEMWDYQWKKTISCLESNLLKTRTRRRRGPSTSRSP